jgi:hypothetical protein
MSLGTIDTAVTRLEVQVERLEADMSELKQDVKAIRAQLDTAAGGWRAFLMVGSAFAAIGAIAAKAFWR